MPRIVSEIERLVEAACAADERLNDAFVRAELESAEHKGKLCAYQDGYVTFHGRDGACPRIELSDCARVAKYLLSLTAEIGDPATEGGN